MPLSAFPIDLPFTTKPLLLDPRPVIAMLLLVIISSLVIFCPSLLAILFSFHK